MDKNEWENKDPEDVFRTEEQEAEFEEVTDKKEERRERMRQQQTSRQPQQEPKIKKQSTIKSGIFGGLIGGATVALLGTGVLVGSGIVDLNQTGQTPTESTTIVDEETGVKTTTINVDVQTGTTQAVETVQEAVVSVINLVESSGNLFGFTIPQSETAESDLVTNGTGSGVVYKVEGDLAYVVTNNHVIDDADALEVMMKDGTKKEAQVVGSDVWTDLAVLTIPAEDIGVVAEFGNSDNLNVGEPAIAIGSPLGTEFATSVTQGIISATERTVETDIDGDGVVDWDVTAIQTDASINPGNSGGALINITGQVIGINSMKIADSNVEGMGFAIPSNDVVHIISELEQHGEVIRPVLGVSMLDLTQVSVSQQQAILKVPADVTSGVVVADVQPVSAAEAAGIEQYDIIVEIAGEEVNNMVELRKVLYSLEVGSTVSISFYRDGELQTLDVTLTDGQAQL